MWGWGKLWKVSSLCKYVCKEIRVYNETRKAFADDNNLLLMQNLGTSVSVCISALDVILLLLCCVASVVLLCQVLFLSLAFLLASL